MSAPRYLAADGQGTVLVEVSDRGMVYVEAFAAPYVSPGGTRVSPAKAREVAAALIAAADEVDPPPPAPSALAVGDVLTHAGQEPPVGVLVEDQHATRMMVRGGDRWWRVLENGQLGTKKTWLEALTLLGGTAVVVDLGLPLAVGDRVAHPDGLEPPHDVILVDRDRATVDHAGYGWAWRRDGQRHGKYAWHAFPRDRFPLTVTCASVTTPSGEAS